MGHFSTFSSSMRGSGIGYTLRRNYPRVKNNASAKQWPWSRRNATDRGFSCGVDGYCVAFATICSASVSVSSVCSIFFFFMPRYLCRHIEDSTIKTLLRDTCTCLSWNYSKKKKKLISSVVLFYFTWMNVFHVLWCSWSGSFLRVIGYFVSK